MDDPYTVQSIGSDSRLQRSLRRARSVFRISVAATILIAFCGLMTGFPAYNRLIKAVEAADLTSMDRAASDVRAVLPIVIAMAMGSAIGLIFVHRFRKRYRKLLAESTSAS